MKLFQTNLYDRGKKNFVNKLIDNKLNKILKISIIVTVVLFLIYGLILINLYIRKSKFNNKYQRIKRELGNKRLTDYEKSKVLFILQKAKKNIYIDDFFLLLMREKPGNFDILSFESNKNDQEQIKFNVEIQVRGVRQNEIDKTKRMIERVFENNNYGMNFFNTDIQNISIMNNDRMVFEYSGMVEKNE